MPQPDDSSFDERLAHWIASQGFWFQLRHSTGRTVGSKLVGRALQVLLRVVILVLLAAGVAAVCLIKRVDMASFQKRLPDAAAAALAAESAEVRGFRREAGRIYIHQLGMKGGKESFFYKLDAGGVRYEMGLLDGLVGEWNAGPITVDEAEIEVKAGAEDEVEAAAAGAALFGAHDWFSFPLIEVLKKASVKWGYSERNFGEIRDSKLIAQRDGDAWQLTFRGGSFSQNWLRELDIEELVLRVAPGRLTIEKGKFLRDGGEVTLSGGVTAGVAPAVDWKMKFERLPLAAILPSEVERFVEGTVSGEATVRGSTSTQDGLRFTCDVLLGSDDKLTLRDRLPLLQALTVVDVYNSYRRIDFTSGTFRFATGGGRMDVDQIDLTAGETVRLSGRFAVRPPTDEEIARALAEGPGTAESSFVETIEDERDGPAKDDDRSGSDEEFTLRDAAKAARGSDDSKQATAPSVEIPGHGPMPSLALDQQARDRYAKQARDRYAKQLRFEGGVVMQIPGDAFERAPLLRERHPADASTNRIALEVPLAGMLFDLTLEQAEEVYVKGRFSN